MQSAALRALEFDRIREALAREALTPLGRARAERLTPSAEPAEVRHRLDLASEAAAFVSSGGSLALRAPEDLDRILDALGVEDRPLDPIDLVGLATFVDSVQAVATNLSRTQSLSAPATGAREVPGLGAIAARVSSFADEATAVRRAIDPGGDLRDDASPALKDIRERLRRQRAKLRATLEGLTRGRETAKYLQDQIVTDRHGRYVVVVRAEHRDAIPGIVHGSSASGASLYLEPLSTVEVNNDIVALAEREKAEILRILLVLTDAFRGRGDDLARTIDAAADLDELAAKASLARRMSAVAPDLADDTRLEFLGARHPLLIPAVRDLFASDEPDADGPARREPPANPIASDLVVVPPTSALVISGPNTGGKTVALKAAGLLAMMAQAGVLVPVDRGSRFTPFRSVFADIGDEQSISASLSTFSARVANLVAMERALALPALVLLDEVGSGTDPVEGGALGIAVIDHFRHRGALVIATTHDDALKSFAATTEGVAAAAFGFTPETYAPTYRLVYGAPGRSLAIEIAQRLGMPASVIDAARARRSGRESALAEHLARVDRELATLAARQSEVDADRARLADERRLLLEREARLAEREALLKRRLDDKLNERLREARAEIDRIVAQAKKKAEALVDPAARLVPGRGGAVSTGELGGLRADARSALGAVEGLLESGSAGADAVALTSPPVVGQRVLVPSFGAEGVVREVSGRRVEVDVRGKRVRLSTSDLRVAGGPGSTEPRAGRVHVDTAPRGATAARELVLVGATVDEALTRAEKFLDDALLADERRLRVVHGHGTGKLRDALRAFFKDHPMVASVSPAPDNEGGAGATIVELRD